MQKKLSMLLSVLLLLGGLTACHGPAEGPEPPPKPVSSAGLSLSPDLSGAPDASTQPIPQPEPAVQYDPGYTLDIKYPKVPKGELELPVWGATGYASVELPVWEEIPEPEPEPEPETEDPTQPADPQPGTEDPAQPADPQPGTEDPTQPADPQPGTEDPAQPADPQPGTEDPAQPADPQPGTEDPAQPAGPQPGTEDPAQTGDISGGQGEASSFGGLTPAPPSPFLPDFSQPGDVSTPSQPTVGPDGEIIYAPGEEPLPEPEPEPDIDPFEGALDVFSPGTPFTVLEESEDGCWWLVECKEGTGWIENRYCLINLPDVIPSMVYNATNSYDSRFRTLGKKIPNITGQAFYPRGDYNHRLERNEFMMPVLYPMAKTICQAQQAALAQGNTLVLYEGYRPHEVQTKVYKALTTLSRNNPKVKEAVASAPWNISWFIAGGYSNHQRGFAMDVSLARIERAELQQIGRYEVLRVREYQEYTMPTPIHELSKAAATYVGPVASHSPTAWKSAKMTDTMAANQPALALQRYCTEAGLTPLASEWWHFNDLDTRTSVLDNLSTGGYKISKCLSMAP